MSLLTDRVVLKRKSKDSDNDHDVTANLTYVDVSLERVIRKVHGLVADVSNKIITPH